MLYLDSVSAQALWGEPAAYRENLVPFLLELHYNPGLARQLWAVADGIYIWWCKLIARRSGKRRRARR